VEVVDVNEYVWEVENLPELSQSALSNPEREGMIVR